MCAMRDSTELWRAGELTILSVGFPQNSKLVAWSRGLIEGAATRASKIADRKNARGKSTKQLIIVNVRFGGFDVAVSSIFKRGPNC
jgi:hypothetical protein